jgi:predicted rRNA methylase YqxC with S4 and FtsJ domains
MEEEANSPLFDLVVMDLSFISLTLVLPNLWKFVEPNGGVVLALVKPQFEQLERSAALRRGKGVVLDDDLRRAALDRVVALVRPPQAPSNDDLTTRGGRSTVDNELEIGGSSEKNCSLSSQSLAGNVKFAEGKTATPAGLLPGAEVVGAIESPVPGGDGNREWLLVLRRHAPGSREPHI